LKSQIWTPKIITISEKDDKKHSTPTIRHKYNSTNIDLQSKHIIDDLKKTFKPF